MVKRVWKQRKANLRKSIDDDFEISELINDMLYQNNIIESNVINIETKITNGQWDGVPFRFFETSIYYKT